MQRIIQLYRNAYSGLSQPAWILALVMFINRSGTMVLPFLPVYLSDSLHFSLKETGLIMSIFGLGSMGGAFLGGWLTDTIGHFKVQMFSLFIGGSFFFVLIQFQDFASVAVGFFILSVITESLRPANASSVSIYTKPENVTRAFSLNRMALNLGFSIGPAIGGMLAAISFTYLFVADGITNILAGILFYFYFRHRHGFKPKKERVSEGVQKSKPPIKDFPFLIFTLMCTLFAMLFFQLFTTVPLYYRDVYQLSEGKIGSLLALNGLIVFLLEMIVVYIFGKRYAIGKLIIMGTIFVGLSYIIFNLFHGLLFLYLAMLVLSVSEILAMPFMATVTVQRSGIENRGAYMGFYTFSYAVAFVLAPYIGTTIIDNYGYETLWWSVGSAALFIAIGFYFAIKNMNR